MEAPLAAASSEGSGRQHNHHRLLSAGFDRLRWAATAVETQRAVQTQPVMSFVSDERPGAAPCQPLPQQQQH